MAKPADTDANGYKLVAGYRVKEISLNGKPAFDIVLSDTQRVVAQALKLSEQFDLFEILSASANPIYRMMATAAASIRAMGNQPIPNPPAPRFFPKSIDELKAVMDEIEEEGLVAVFAVLSDKGASKDPVEKAKN
jgi:hypothetical protein